MKKCFIFHTCGECGEPTYIISPCEELGYNNFPSTNFHGELSLADTEKLRCDLIESLRKDGKIDEANYMETNSKVFEVTFTL